MASAGLAEKGVWDVLKMTRTTWRCPGHPLDIPQRCLAPGFRAGMSYMITGGDFETSPKFLIGMEHQEFQTWYMRELQLHSCNAWDAEW